MTKFRLHIKERWKEPKERETNELNFASKITIRMVEWYLTELPVFFIANRIKLTAFLLACLLSAGGMEIETMHITTSYDEKTEEKK